MQCGHMSEQTLELIVNILVSAGIPQAYIIMFESDVI